MNTMTPLRLGENLLENLQERVFGIEERTEVERRNVGLEVSCSSGNRPAGVVLSIPDRYIPRGARLDLSISGHGDEGFGMSVVEGGADAPDPPDTLVVAGNTRFSVPMSDGNHFDNRPVRHDIVLTCPRHAAELALSEIRLVPSPCASGSRSTATWIWRAGPWLKRPGVLLTRLEENGIDRVWLQLEVDKGRVRRAKDFARLVGMLGASGIAVAAVEGDPAMVTPDGLDAALARAAALRRYNEETREAALLQGLQYDIEPYLLSGYHGDPSGVWGDWARAVERLAEAWQAPVSVVVPFWMLEADGGADALARARPSVSSVTVMAYRTNTAEVVALSEPWLFWGGSHEIPVQIALENGKLPEQIHRTYVRSRRGEVHLSTEDSKPSVTLVDTPAAGGAGEHAYAFSHEVHAGSGRVSFENDIPKLASVMADIQRILPAWWSFNGLVIHELLRSRTGVGAPKEEESAAR